MSSTTLTRETNWTSNCMYCTRALYRGDLSPNKLFLSLSPFYVTTVVLLPSVLCRVTFVSEHNHCLCSGYNLFWHIRYYWWSIIRLAPFFMSECLPDDLWDILRDKGSDQRLSCGLISVRIWMTITDQMHCVMHIGVVSMVVKLIWSSVENISYDSPQKEFK